MATQLTALDAFPQFLQLPPELRFKIWEETWSEPRVIEVTCGESYDEVELDDFPVHPRFISLRPLCSLSRWIEEFENDTYRDFESEEPLETCPNPLALYVCHESRIHTLRRHIKLQHKTLTHSVFYVNPRVDILWLTEDSSDCFDKVSGLKDSYGDQLAALSRVLVEEVLWDTREYLLEFFDMLSGLDKIIMIVDKHELLGIDAGHQTITTKMYEEAIICMKRKVEKKWAGKRSSIQFMDSTAISDISRVIC